MADNQKIIDAATVSLFKGKDSSLFKTTLTDKKGNFFLKIFNMENIIVMATSTGHLQNHSSTVQISNGSLITRGCFAIGI